MSEEPRGWTAMVWTRQATDAFGATMISKRLHWTQREAMAEAEDWLLDAKAITVVSWEFVDDAMAIAHAGQFVVAVRSFLLPA